MFASWTTDFDCGHETGWWYVIKDSQFDITQLKAKRRYEITKGNKNFCIKEIKPKDCAEDLYVVYDAAVKSYGKKFGDSKDREFMIGYFKKMPGVFLGAFLNDEEGNVTTKLCGFACLNFEKSHIGFRALKAIPAYEKLGLNAALVNGVLEYCNEDLKSGKYINDGQRSLNHETAFQDYLEKYFGFRKAYCNLHIVYRPVIKWIIPMLYCFRKALKRLDGIKIMHLVNVVLCMEEINRKCREKKNE